MVHEKKSMLTRRKAVQFGAASLATLGATRSVTAQDATPDASPVDGEWTFTDDKGVTVTLPARPERLVIDVNAAAPLWDFGIEPTALFGWNVLADGSLGDAGGNIDPEAIPTVGDVNEPIRVEDLIAVEPDLIITISTSLNNDPEEYWSIDASVLEQVRGVAPIVAISTTGAANEAGPRDAALSTERFAELAGALGADLESDELVAAKADYEAALEHFSHVAGENSDLTSLFVASGDDVTWVAWEPAWADLSLYSSLGLNIIELESHDGWWEQISHEQALRYPTDVLFVSTRSAHTLDAFTALPSWGQHPAVAAGQAYGWNQDFILSYQGMTEALNRIADALTNSEKVV